MCSFRVRAASRLTTAPPASRYGLGLAMDGGVVTLNSGSDLPRRAARADPYVCVFKSDSATSISDWPRDIQRQTTLWPSFSGLCGRMLEHLLGNAGRLNLTSCTRGCGASPSSRLPYSSSGVSPGPGMNFSQRPLLSCQSCGALAAAPARSGHAAGVVAVGRV